MTDTRVSGGDDRTSHALASAFEEYRTLRAEITAALASQHAVLSYGIAALALSSLAIGNAWQTVPGFAGLVLMTAIPSGIFLVVMLWGTELARMHRAGLFIAEHLEPQINDLAGTPYALSWERWLAGDVPPRMAQKPKPRSLNLGIGAAGVMWLVLSFSSFAVGAYRFDSQADYMRHVAAESAKASANATSPLQTPSRPTKVLWFYRWWHFPWPLSARSLRHGSEVSILFLLFVLVPFGYASLTFFRNKRRLASGEFPPYISTTASGSIAEILRESTSEALIGFWPSYQAGKYDEAVVILTRMLLQYPDDPAILFSLACCESRAGKSEVALQDLGRAIALGGKRILWLARDAEDFSTLKDCARFRELIDG
jgi:tetratricopeptide (TPR) repeat protein